MANVFLPSHCTLCYLGPHTLKQSHAPIKHYSFKALDRIVHVAMAN